jgi:electron transfer flavoprotein alpha subunit
VSLELLHKSREIADNLGWHVGGLLIGHKVKSLIPYAIHCGVDKIWLADYPLLASFSIEAYCHTAYQAILSGKPSVFLCGATPNGRDLAGRLAVRLRTGLNADCSNLYMDIDKVVLVSEVSGFGGGVLALIEMADHRPQMATVKPGVFTTAKPDSRRLGEVNKVPVNLYADMIRTKLLEQITGESLDLTNAEYLVIGGRGIGDSFQLISELANLLGGDYGTTRPPVDDGYIERERMVGQTGVICKPKIAICCGISGAFHFIVGIQQADIVIAINNDPDAPIFDHADYCIVGDINEILPALIQSLKSVRNTFTGQPMDNI